MQILYEDGNDNQLIITTFLANLYNDSLDFRVFTSGISWPGMAPSVIILEIFWKEQ